MNGYAAFFPFLRLPDTGIVLDDYIPQNKLVKLESLKFYFISFRNVGIFQENVIYKIFNGLNLLLEPEELLIKTRYRTRGGIDITCIKNSNE